MELRPILSTLLRHKASALLIASEIALTLAIVCNAAYIIRWQRTTISRPTGTDETHLFSVHNHWIKKLDSAALSSQRAADLAALRGLPGVVDATASNNVPLGNDSQPLPAARKADQAKPTTSPLVYCSDAHALDTFGLKLIAGRWFHAGEISDVDYARQGIPTPPVVVVTRALADKLFPDLTSSAAAVGKTFYLSNQPTTIVGVVERMEGANVGIDRADVLQNARVVLTPQRFLFGDYYYIVRTRPGRMIEVMQAARAKLLALDRGRVLSKLQPFAATREDAYRDFRGIAKLLAGISAFLLTVTAFGIGGLTMFWVTQRRRQIGIRRALGATRGDILRYFLTENLMIGLAGVVSGLALALGLNLLMVTHFQMHRISPAFLLGGAAGLLLLGLLTVLGPALRAARVPPVVATRTV